MRIVILEQDGDQDESAPRVLLSQDNVGASGYNIYRSASACGSPAKVGTATTTSYADTGLTAAAPHRYVVKVFDGVPNESLENNKATATTR
jgi:cellulose 1,4-beta-cellobiosidase